MTKKLILSSIAASALALATLSYAAPGSAPKEPAPATQVASKIDMAAALQAAQAKFPEASALSASLHGTRGGYGPGYGPGCGMGMNPDCPYYGEGRPHHRGGWHHGGRHGGWCPWF